MHKVYSLNKVPATNKNYHEKIRYIGVNIGKFYLPYFSSTEWFMLGDDSFRESVTAVPTNLSEIGRKLNSKADSLIFNVY